jgi:5-methylcytosine-specific restriction endonuclease McrA
MQIKEKKRRESAEYVELNKKRSLEWSRAHLKERCQRAKKQREERIDECREKARASYQKRKQIILAQQRFYYQQNREQVKASNARWRAANPEKVREIVRTVGNRRRARLANSLATLTVQQWAAILELYQGRCAYCGTSGKMEQDHVIPVSRGGGTTAENIVPACGTCNRSKNARTPEEWRALNKPLN